MLKLTGPLAIAGVLLSATSGAAQTCAYCRSYRESMTLQNARTQRIMAPELAAGQYGWSRLFTSTTPKLAVLLKIKELSEDTLIEKRQILEAKASTGAIFGTHGGESLISEYSALPGILNFSSDPIAATTAYQAPLVGTQHISPAIRTVLIWTIRAVRSWLFNALTALTLCISGTWLVRRKWQRARRDAELRSLGLKRIRVRKKHRRAIKRKGAKSVIKQGT